MILLFLEILINIKWSIKPNLIEKLSNTSFFRNQIDKRDNNDIKNLFIYFVVIILVFFNINILFSDNFSYITLIKNMGNFYLFL